MHHFRPHQVIKSATVTSTHSLYKLQPDMCHTFIQGVSNSTDSTKKRNGRLLGKPAIDGQIRMMKPVAHAKAKGKKHNQACRNFIQTKLFNSSTHWHWMQCCHSVGFYPNCLDFPLNFSVWILSIKCLDFLDFSSLENGLTFHAYQTM